MKEIFIKCECGTEGVLLEKDDDLGGFVMSFFGTSIYTFAKGSLWQRFRLALRVMFKGRLYHDQILISKENAKEICQYFGNNGVDGYNVNTYTMDELYQALQQNDG